MLALFLNFLVLLLQVLNLRVFGFQFFESLVVLRVGMRGLNSVFFLFSVYLLVDLCQFLQLDIVASRLIFDLLQFVELF